MAANTYLPGSMKGAKFYQETLVLLWQFLEENEEFERWCIEKEDVNEVRAGGAKRRQHISKLFLDPLCSSSTLTSVASLLAARRTYLLPYV
jgi:hypothetical protein